MTEQTGFDSEPTYPLAEQAENQVLRERLYAAQNTVVRLESERRGKVLVDPEDLRQVLTLAARDPASWSDAGRGAYNRTFDAAEAAVAAVGVRVGPQSAGAPGASQRAGHRGPCERCNGSGSEPGAAS